MPNAAPSSLGGKTALMMPSPCGIISAPNAPCSARLPINISGEAARAHSAEPSVNPAAPSRNNSRRPKMSPSRPLTTSSTANASV